MGSWWSTHNYVDTVAMWVYRYYSIEHTPVLLLLLPDVGRYLDIHTYTWIPGVMRCGVTRSQMTRCRGDEMLMALVPGWLEYPISTTYALLVCILLHTTTYTTTTAYTLTIYR